MATYGQHECMYMDNDVTIDRWAGDWYYTVHVEIDNTEDTQEYKTQIKFCPFCGEELNYCTLQ